MFGEVKMVFEPKSVVLLGSSGMKGRAGVASATLFRSAVNNMLRFYKGKTYIVDLSGRLSGAAKDLRQIPKKCDLALLMLPPELALKHLQKLFDREVKAIVAAAGGYTREQRERLVRSAAKKGVRILGPNIVTGLINTANGLCIAFDRDTMLGRGGISIISQSGEVGAAMLDWAWFYGVGVSKFASVGDEVDIDGAELVGYLVGDKDTKVICIYVERIRDGRRLIDAVHEAVKRKPVVVLKGGIAREEAHTVISSLASLAERNEIFGAAFEQAGAIMVQNVEELFDVADALARQPSMRGSRVAIVDISGHAILALDAIHREGLAPASFSDKAIRAITSRYPEIDVINPISLSTDNGVERYKFVLENVLADPNVDGVLVMTMLKPRFLKPEDLRIMGEVARKFRDKSIVDVTVGGEDHALVQEVLKDTGIPTYNTPSRAARCLRALYLYGKIREKVLKEEKSLKRPSDSKPETKNG